MDATQFVVVCLLALLVYSFFVWSRGVLHRFRLPPPTLAPGRPDVLQKEAFREICRLSQGPGDQVSMADYFARQGWNRADAMLVMAEPVKHRLVRVRGWRFGQYGVTKQGWAEYQRNFMWTGGSEGMHISAKDGSFIVANVNSAHAVAHGGVGNQVGRSEISHRQLVDALRTDADSATPEESVRAREYADDLAEAVQSDNSDRTDRILGRINQLLTTAGSAFSLTRALLRPDA